MLPSETKRPKQPPVCSKTCKSGVILAKERKCGEVFDSGILSDSAHVLCLFPNSNNMILTGSNQSHAEYESKSRVDQSDSEAAFIPAAACLSKIFNHRPAAETPLVTV